MAVSPSTRKGSDDQLLGIGAPLRLVTGSGDATVKVFNRPRSYFVYRNRSFLHRSGIYPRASLYSGIPSSVGKALSSLSSYEETLCTLDVRMATSKY